MLYKVFMAQLRNPTKGDWPLIVQKDLEDLNIKYTFDEIKKMKQERFKDIVKKACKSYSLTTLLKLKEKHKKR